MAAMQIFRMVMRCIRLEMKAYSACENSVPSPYITVNRKIRSPLSA